MNEWKVVYTEQAEHDLRSIYEYIAFALFEPEIARKQVKRILDSVATLSQMPLRCPLYEHEPWRSRELRALRVDHYLAFYLPIEAKKTVAILRMMYGGRNLEEQLYQAGTNG